MSAELVTMKCNKDSVILHLNDLIVLPPLIWFKGVLSPPGNFFFFFFVKIFYFHGNCIKLVTNLRDLCVHVSACFFVCVSLCANKTREKNDQVHTQDMIKLRFTNVTLDLLTKVYFSATAYQKVANSLTLKTQ